MAQTVDMKVGGELTRLRLDELDPDPLNPRLPAEVQRKDLKPAELFPYLDRVYDVFSIAESILRHGYFEAEPLVAIPSLGKSGKPRNPKRYIVVEGNRRLAALKGLANPKIRASLPTKGWREIPADADVPVDVPVLVVESRSQAAPILGFRHITRPAPWAPLPQAKYIADLVDDQGLSFAEVAALLSRGEPEVRSFYRNYWIRRQGEEKLGLRDSARITDNFGVFTRAMQNPGIRDYIGAPPPRGVDQDYFPLPDDREEELSRLTTWLFGPPRNGGAAGEQVVQDSRQITSLGRVLEDQEALSILEDTNDLEAARQSTVDPISALVRSIRSSIASIKRVQKEMNGDGAPLAEARKSLEACLEHYESSDLG